MNFIFQCKIILGPELEPVQNHELGNTLSGADSSGMLKVAIHPSMLTVTCLVQTRAVPTFHRHVTHRASHIHTAADTHTHTQPQTHACGSDTQQHALHRCT